jgi:5-methylcytosine-specific restriction endonuclease McrA
MKSALNESVLVLNRLWQAVNVCTARRAFCLLYQKHAQVVHAEGKDFTTLDFEDWLSFSSRFAETNHAVQTVSRRIAIPKVILLAFFDRSPRKEIKLTRCNIFERDRHQCQYCGKVLSRQELNLDHVHPRDRGGLTTWENVVCSCIACNARKRNLTPQEAGMRLLRSPSRPRWRPFLMVSNPPREESLWRHFLDPSLWNVELGEERAS